MAYYGFGTTSDVLTSGGTPNLPTFQAGGGGAYYSVTPYIVGQVGDTHAQYTGATAIGDAITQAVADGLSNSNPLNIYLKPGTYSGETFVLPVGIRLVGLGQGMVGAEGGAFANNEVVVKIDSATITMSGSSGGVAISNVSLTSSSVTTSGDNTLVFDSCYISSSIANSGSDILIFGNCVLTSGSFTSGANGFFMYLTSCNLASYGLNFNHNATFTMLGSSTDGSLTLGGTTRSVTANYTNCLLTSGAFIDNSGATTPNSTCNVQSCVSVSPTYCFNVIQNATINCRDLTVRSGTFFINEGSGSNSYNIFSSNIDCTNLINGVNSSVFVFKDSRATSTSTGITLGTNASVYFENCDNDLLATPTLGSGSKIIYQHAITNESSAANPSTVINSLELSTTATDGFLHVPSCNGAPMGTPTLYGSAIPMVYDTSGSVLYVYTGGSWTAV